MKQLLENDVLVGTVVSLLGLLWLWGAVAQQDAWGMLAGVGLLLFSMSVMLKSAQQAWAPRAVRWLYGSGTALFVVGGAVSLFA